VRLVVLNGPPGIGKSTLADRYVGQHPLALCLDIDGIRRQLGGWDTDEQASGRLARDLAVAMARVHLLAGHDVVVPQYLGRVALLERLEALATEVGASFHDVMLMDSREAAVARFAARASDPVWATHHGEAVRMVGTEGVGPLYDRLAAVLAARPATVVLESRFGDADETFTLLMTALSASGP
jgi:predicted kinase